MSRLNMTGSVVVNEDLIEFGVYKENISIWLCQHPADRLYVWP